MTHYMFKFLTFPLYLRINYPEMKYRLRLSYNGAAFSGWQIQPNAPSVQECIQHVLSILLNEEITVTGAGRTDTKVSASKIMAWPRPDNRRTRHWKGTARVPGRIVRHLNGCRYLSVPGSIRGNVCRGRHPALSRLLRAPCS